MLQSYRNYLIDFHGKSTNELPYGENNDLEVFNFYKEYAQQYSLTTPSIHSSNGTIHKASISFHSNLKWFRNISMYEIGFYNISWKTKKLIMRANCLLSLFIQSFCEWLTNNPAGNYMFKVNNRNTKTRYEISSKLTIKTPEQYHWRSSGLFIVNFEEISHLS